MNARALVLYAAVVLIWGSTWIAIPLQLGVVAEEVSVAWRFALGSLALFVYAAVTGRQIRIPLKHYGMVILMGALMFSANYLFTYYSINYVTSGLVAVVFSLIVVFNAFFERIFFGRPLERRLIVASVLGVVGVAFMFWPEVRTFNLRDESMYGVTLALIAVVLASIGNMAAIVNTNRHLPVMSMNAHGMAWGAAASLIVSALAGKEIGFLFQPGYIMSLLYLSVFGSAVAFGCYLALLRQIGSARAAYTAVLFPIVALILSTLFEDYAWTLQSVVGVLFILAGNWLALTRIEGN
jgi:drug/metabolite transporter (DMT)-like permease